MVDKFRSVIGKRFEPVFYVRLVGDKRVVSGDFVAPNVVGQDISVKQIVIVFEDIEFAQQQRERRIVLGRYKISRSLRIFVKIGLNRFERSGIGVVNCGKFY